MPSPRTSTESDRRIVAGWAADFAEMGNRMGRRWPVAQGRRRYELTR